MISPSVPCPVCKSLPVLSNFKTGFSITCTGPMTKAQKAAHSFDLCPICGNATKTHQVLDGWVKSCVGARHYFGTTDDGRHTISIYRCEVPEEAVDAWNRFMAPKPAAEVA